MRRNQPITSQQNGERLVGVGWKEWNTQKGRREEEGERDRERDGMKGKVRNRLESWNGRDTDGEKERRKRR